MAKNDVFWKHHSDSDFSNLISTGMNGLIKSTLVLTGQKQAINGQKLSKSVSLSNDL